MDRVPGNDQLTANMERIYRWDKALSENNAEDLLELYAKDRVIESPLIPHLLGKEEGVCRGQEEMRRLFEAVASREPTIRQYYRTGYLSDGEKKMTFEYPQGEQWILSKSWN